MKLEFSRQVFEKSLNIKFHQNLYHGSQVIPCRQADRWMDMTKLIVAVYSFVTVPKNEEGTDVTLHLHAD
jgi:hypothetical protein